MVAAYFDNRAFMNAAVVHFVLIGVANSIKSILSMNGNLRCNKVDPHKQ